MGGLRPFRLLGEHYGLSGYNLTRGCYVKDSDLIQRLISDGEFGWGGTSVKEQRRCPKMSSVRTEISGRTEG